MSTRAEFWKRWKDEYKPNKHRLGQAFVNHFNVSSNDERSVQLAGRPTLYYETQEDIAMKAIQHFFAKWQTP